MNESAVNTRVRVGMITLGCAKNLVDAEIMLGDLMKHGIEVTNDSEQADVLIVNTCSFIDAAQEESVDTILESAQVREARNRRQGLIVSGCLPQRFREELPKLLPEVDAFMGIDQVAQVHEIVHQAVANREKRLTKQTLRRQSNSLSTKKVEVNRSIARLEKTKTLTADQVLERSPTPMVDVHARPTYIPDFATPRFRLTPRHFAYVKIAEGCNHPCTFCIIPRMRGRHRSRTQADIVSEVRQLVEDGVKEINLISQDSTYYGLDLRPDHRPNIASPDRFKAAAQALPVDSATLGSLLRDLNDIPGDFWIRLLYTHPAHWTDELIQTIAQCPKVARYVDIPLQHIHPVMLERMRRETTSEYILDLLARIRAGIPGIAIRTTFIVGFPGETEPIFNHLLRFIEETRFERLGVFTYSKEEGTLAGRMASQVTARVKQKRRDRAMALQHRISTELSQSLVGQTMKVLVEREATARDLKQARIYSWEHGLIRESDNRLGNLRGAFLLARGQTDAPDIDGRVYIHGQAQPGEFATVKITGHTDYDLLATPVS